MKQPKRIFRINNINYNALLNAKKITKANKYTTAWLLLFCTATVILLLTNLDPISINKVENINSIHNTTPDYPVLYLYNVSESPLRSPQSYSYLKSKEPIENNKALTCDKIEINKGDNITKIFKRAGINQDNLKQLLENDKHGDKLHTIVPGNNLCIKHDDGELEYLKYKVNSKHALVFDNEQGNLYLQKHPYEHKQVFRKITIKNSLFSSGKEIGLSEKTMINLVTLFGWEIDFAADIREDDKFSVLYEEKYLDGELIDTGNILAAKFTNKGKDYYAIRYVNKKGEVNYYNLDGDNLKRPFIRIPVKFTRISSPFNLNRMHPILHKIRAHRGVDYAAPTGTPIKASGDGKVTFKGVQRGYGNVIILQHGRKYSTLYAHLSKFNSKLKVGSRVKQGDIIAYVGSTGLATAPHLHYEFRIDGVHKDPVTVELPKADPIPSREKNHFLQHAYKILQSHDF